jgi:hypothetical protein
MKPVLRRASGCLPTPADRCRCGRRPAWVCAAVTERRPSFSPSHSRGPRRLRGLPREAALSYALDPHGQPTGAHADRRSR